MRTTIATFMSLWVGLAAVGCADLGPSGNNDDFGSASDAGASYDLGVNQCAVVIVTPSGGVAPVALAASTKVQTGLTPDWVLETPSGLVKPVALDGTGLRVGYEATEPGTYTFHVDFHSSMPCPGAASAIVTPPAALSQLYRLRVTPPASTLLPQQDRIMSLSGSTALTALDLTLDSGVPIPGVLMGPNGPVGGEVALFPVSGPELRVAVGANGAFTLPVRLDATYRVVLIPADSGLAPMALGPFMGADLLSTPLQVGAGLPVSGTVRDELAAVMPDARVVLRAGVQPSGVGTSGADGTYALRMASAGHPPTLSVSRVGWPDLELPDVTYLSSGLVADIAFALPRIAMTARVVRADGVTPVSGARVTIRSQPLAGAATVSYAATAHDATGTVRLARTSLADGTLGALPLPAGVYDILVEPPALPAGATEGITGLRVTVATAGELRLALSPSSTLSGQVSSPAGPVTAGARVRVRAQTGGAWAETTSRPDGTFAIATPAGVPLELVVEPPPSLSLASVRQNLGTIGDPLGGSPPPPVQVFLAKGLAVAGVVRSATAVVVGATIDALCYACGDPTVLAHAETDDTGHYRIFLPDPGVANVDAGGF